MSGQVYLTGIVLSAMPVNDYDRRLSILSFENGRVSAFARGARRPKNQLTAFARPFTYGRFTAYEGRDSYTVTDCEDAVFFDRLEKDPEKTYYGMYFCELMEYLTRENSEDREQVKLLYTTLSALGKEIVPVTLIRRIFELRAFANYGEAPNIFECRKCHCKTCISGWHMNRRLNSVICRDCYEKENETGFSESDNLINISETVRYTIHYCITSTMKKLYGFTLSEEVLSEFESFVDDYVKRHTDKKMKSLDIIEML